MPRCASPCSTRNILEITQQRRTQQRLTQRRVTQPRRLRFRAPPTRVWEVNPHRQARGPTPGEPSARWDRWRVGPRARFPAGQPAPLAPRARRSRDPPCERIWTCSPLRHTVERLGGGVGVPLVGLWNWSALASRGFPPVGLPCLEPRFPDPGPRKPGVSEPVRVPRGCLLPSWPPGSDGLSRPVPPLPAICQKVAASS